MGYKRATRIMKKILFYAFLILGLFSITSCKSSGEPSGPDPRDLLLGTYSYTMTGNYVMHFAGQNINVPLGQGGVLKIIKDGSGNRVRITGNEVSATGVVENDVLKLDPESQTETKDGLTVIMRAIYEPAQLVNGSLTVNVELTGTVSGGGYSGTIEGSQIIKATKQ